VQGAGYRMQGAGYRMQGAGDRMQGAGDRNTRIGRSQRSKISDHIFDLREPVLTKEGFVLRSSIPWFVL